MSVIWSRTESSGEIDGHWNRLQYILRQMSVIGSLILLISHSICDTSLFIRFYILNIGLGDIKSYPSLIISSLSLIHPPSHPSYNSDHRSIPIPPSIPILPSIPPHLWDSAKMSQT